MLGFHTWLISHRLKILSFVLVLDLGSCQIIDRTSQLAEVLSRHILRECSTSPDSFPRALIYNSALALSPSLLLGHLKLPREDRWAVLGEVGLYIGETRMEFIEDFIQHPLKCQTRCLPFTMILWKGFVR
jgi:hypothetical protein